MKNMVKIYTQKCFVCGEKGTVDIEASDEQLDNYEKGMLIQQAFPHISAPIREQIMSGTHPLCWDKMWEGHEDD